MVAAYRGHETSKQQHPSNNPESGRRSNINNNNNQYSKHVHERRSLSPNEMELISAMAERLETGLNDEALAAICDLLNAGVHPDAVVAVVASLQQIAPFSTRR